MDKKIFSIKRDTLFIYLKSLIPYIIIASIVFLIGGIAGYYFSELYPSRAQELISLLREVYSPVFKESKISQILFVFLKNGITSFLTIALGVLFGIFPLIILLNNGEVLGMLASIVFRNYGIFYFFTGILTHGIVEIPCFLISSAIGLKIGIVAIRKVLRKEVSVVNEINQGLALFLILLIFLFIAAVIETLITPELLRIY
ncbi:MAG TPA: hypothetical protein ENF31_01120 [bacterium]|nr:hypothetical protein [bacterium]